MNFEQILEYYLSRPDVTEGFLFNDIALVFKVGGKCLPSWVFLKIPGAFKPDLYRI